MHARTLRPTGVDLLHDPTLNKGTAFTDEERDRLEAERAAAAEGADTRTTGAQGSGEPSKPALRHRRVLVFARVAGPERASLLSRRHRSSSGDDAHHLHADRGARLPAVWPHLAARARAVHHGPGPWQGDRRLTELALRSRSRRRGDRWRTDSRPGRSGCQWHGHPGREAVADTACAGYIPPGVSP